MQLSMGVNKMIDPRSAGSVMTVGDTASFSLVLLTLLDKLPSIAAIFSIAWTLMRIYLDVKEMRNKHADSKNSKGKGKTSRRNIRKS